MNDAKLLPCPFCGSAVISRSKDGEYHVIQCAQCGCEMANTIRYKLDSAWNRRTPHPSPVTAREAELEAEIERLTKARDNLSRLEQSHREQANEQFHRAEKAEVERNEALAQVAMAYELAADEMIMQALSCVGNTPIETVQSAIRALAPADAKVALEAYGREKVREGMQRAADIAAEEALTIAMSPDQARALATAIVVAANDAGAET